MISNKWLKHGGLTFLEHSSTRVLDAIVSLLLIRFFSSEQFGLFSVYQSWVALLLFFFPSFEDSLYRNYWHLKSENKLQGEIEIYLFTIAIKLLLAAISVAALTFININASDWVTRLALLSFAAALPLSQSFYGIMREPLRFEMQQGKVFIISAIQRICLIGGIALSLVFFPGNIILLCFLGFLIFIIFGGVWNYMFQRCLGVLNQSTEIDLINKLKTIWYLLKSTVFWLHLIGISMLSMQTMDLFWLSYHNTSLAQTGFYALSLKAANFFQLLPLALMNAFGVYLGKSQNNSKKEISLTTMHTLGILLISLTLFALGVRYGDLLISFLGKGKLDTSTLKHTVTYFQWHLAGVLILCATHPLSTYLGARSSLKKLTLYVYLPWVVLGNITYYVAARSGLFQAAQANIIVYLYLALLLFAFTFFSKDTTQNEH